MLLDIFEELQLSIAGFLTDPSDCGALCIAAPQLGLLARRTLPQYKEVLVLVAMRLATVRWRRRPKLMVDEALLRRYLSDKRMTPEGCTWLTAAAEKTGSPHRIIVHADQQRWFVRTRASPWHVSDALVREASDRGGKIHFYEGEHGEERLVRVQRPDGCITHCEGERGAERLVREELPDGTVDFFEDGLVVRTELPDGTVRVYQGGRLVRAERPDGDVHFFEDGLVVRTELPDGSVRVFEGGLVVRMELPDGDVHFFEDGLVVRTELPDGSVRVHEGGRLREELPDGTVRVHEGGRLVRAELPDGDVHFFEGGLLVRAELPDGTVRLLDRRAQLMHAYMEHVREERARYGVRVTVYT